MVRFLLLLIVTVILASCVSTSKGPFYVVPEAEVAAIVAKDTLDCAKEKFKKCVFPDSKSGETSSIPNGLSNEELEAHAKKMRNK